MRRATALFVAVGVLLTGCVGIPTSGDVAVGPTIDDQVVPDFVVTPSSPRPGSDQEELLEDFMLAQRGPQGGYAIAKQFLTTDFSAVWDPEESATVRTGNFDITSGADADTLHYTVTTTGVVDKSGRYTQSLPALQTFDFSFQKEGGEWRISAAPNGVVLSQASFNSGFTERALYFFDPSFGYLVPDVRWFASRPTLLTRVAGALTEGPASWLQQGVVLSSFPIATTVKSVDITSGAATVELSDEALTASPQDRDRMRQQLTATLDVATVVMRVGGLVLATPALGAAAVKNPFVESAVLVGTGDQFGFDTGDGISIIDGLSAKVIAAGATAATLSNDKGSAALVTPAGIALVRAATDDVVVLDQGTGFIAPSLDPFRFVWVAEASSAASVTAFGVDGAAHAIQSSLPADASVVSIDVSRDGTRLLVYMSTTVGPKLTVYGIIRQQGSNIPTSLGEPLELPVAAGVPIDATWVDDRTVATISRGAEVSPVSLIEVGGPSVSLGPIGDALAIAGGNNGSDGLRILRENGEIWRSQSGGWVSTGLSASFIGTKQ